MKEEEEVKQVLNAVADVSVRALEKAKEEERIMKLLQKELARNHKFRQFAEDYKDTMRAVADRKIYSDLEDVDYHTYNDDELNSKYPNTPDVWFDVADSLIKGHLDVVWSNEVGCEVERKSLTEHLCS